ncbi:hypothetical protein STRMA_1859 [Streptococcus macacae NCTC 11558]|uniref:Uncharacterized protein n=2 Tax=Streptococcus macacae TaxID=1339 RepID=G5JWB3_9STRE|nr:competence type IV pilus minor pilin ComGG [Streptococcus macacae]EHJ51805.1 hypothetical protein STRMA_1859 [Streptococcus macacae NCTC 11558]
MLQFYLDRVVATERQNKMQLLSSKSYLIALITRDSVKEHSGQFEFSDGVSHYNIVNGRLQIDIKMKDDVFYHYHFPYKVKDNQNKIKENKEIKREMERKDIK